MLAGHGAHGAGACRAPRVEAEFRHRGQPGHHAHTCPLNREQQQQHFLTPISAKAAPAQRHAHHCSICGAVSHTQAHTPTHAHTHLHACTHTYKHNRARVHTQAHTHTYTCAHTQTRGHTYKYTCTHTRAHAHLHIHARIHAHTHTNSHAHMHIHAQVARVIVNFSASLVTSDAPTLVSCFNKI